LADEFKFKEVPMTINGHELTLAQCVALRCAVNIFVLSIPDLKLNHELERGYSTACQEILDMMRRER
jgi:hypothetical protein